MKLTIIPSDGFVAENGVGYDRLSWEGTPSNVHALQWDSSTPINRVIKSVTEELVDGALIPVAKDSISTYYGWIEFNDGTPNQDISTLPSWVVNAELAWTEANTPKPPVPPTAEQNKATAMGLLSATDWVNQPDVRDTAVSPHLVNGAEFDAYRLQVRQIAVYPVAGDLTWPTLPVEVWA